MWPDKKVWPLAFCSSGASSNGKVAEVSAGEAVVPASELVAIVKLQRSLGKKTLENESLKEAVEYAAEKKWIARSPLLPGDDQ